MKLTIDHVRDIAVVRVAESRLMYPLLSDFSTAVVGLIAWSVVAGYLTEFPSLVRLDLGHIWAFTHAGAATTAQTLVTPCDQRHAAFLAPS